MKPQYAERNPPGLSRKACTIDPILATYSSGLGVKTVGFGYADAGAATARNLPRQSDRASACFQQWRCGTTRGPNAAEMRDV